MSTPRDPASGPRTYGPGRYGSGPYSGHYDHSVTDADPYSPDVPGVTVGETTPPVMSPPEGYPGPRSGGQGAGGPAPVGPPPQAGPAPVAAGYYQAPPNVPVVVYQQKPPTNVLGIVSMSLGILGCIMFMYGVLFGLAAVILGHIGMRQIARQGQQGKGFAIAGLITGYVSTAWILFWIFAIIMVIVDMNSY
ncbi:DUF4190 domain-containing protein [Brevibacterium litoralis]|uniref:DUF4190 domain-containing protein n=1 Tax=Brevibacterium litoralis TaxID=3138935 RepID=UPI0032EE35E4